MDNNKRTFKPPLSGEIIGKILEALQIRNDVLASKTASRLFKGERIGEKRRNEILASAADVLVSTGVIPHIPKLESSGMELNKVLMIVFAFQADRWDRLVGFIRNYAYPISRQELAPDKRKIRT